jgi:hypothetical protein
MSEIADGTECKRSPERYSNLDELYAILRRVADDVSSTMAEVSSTKVDIAGMKSDISGMKSDVNSVKKSSSETKMMLLDHIDKEDAVFVKHEGAINSHGDMLIVQSESMKRVDKTQAYHAEAIGELAGLHQAIPIDPLTGKTDIKGHHDAHVTLMTDAKVARARWEKLRDIVVEFSVKGALAAFSFIVVTGLVEYIKHPIAPSTEQIKEVTKKE